MKISTIFAIGLFGLLSACSSTPSRMAMLSDIKTAEHEVVGIGESAHPNSLKSKEEAKSRAFQDIATQLRSSVSSMMKIEETDKDSAFSGLISVDSSLEDLVGVRFVKEGRGKDDLYYQVYALDVQAAYNGAIGFATVLEKKLLEVQTWDKNKDFVKVVTAYHRLKDEIKEGTPAVLRADVYKTFLKIEGQSWWERIKGKEVELDRLYRESKEKIVFYINDFPNYQDVVLDTEAMLGEQGFSTQVGGEKPKNGFEIEFKLAGEPRRTTTALGETFNYRFGILLKDLSTKKTLGANSATSVKGFSKTGNQDEALEVASKQMTLNVSELLKKSLPGLIND